MSKVNEILQEQIEEQNATQNQTETVGPESTNSEQDFQPIFEEIQEMNPGGAVNVLIQAAQQAQAAGALTLRDSVVVAQAINILRPGSI
jgi:hypothetical protein